MTTTPTVEAEQPDTPEVDETPVTAETTDEAQAADGGAAPDEGIAPSKEVARVDTGHGLLTVDPDQERWNETQRIALEAMGIETRGPDAVPPGYVAQFLHIVQSADLDPFRKEATLITFGKRWVDKSGEVVDRRKYALVVLIDGFRRRGGAMGDYAGQVGPQWAKDTGEWVDMWNPAWGLPVAARVGIMRKGFDVPVWGVVMYAEMVAMVDEYVDDPNGRNKRRKTGRKVPTESWERMPALMTAKCAEAQAWRKAYPRTFSGIYTGAEMSNAVGQHDDAERELAAEQGRQRRLEAIKAARAQVVQGTVESSSTEPVRAGEVAQQVVEQVRDAQDTPAQDAAPDARVDDETRAAWLRAEIEEQARILDTTVAALTTRQVRAARKNSAAELTVTELATAAHMMREMVTAELRKTGRNDEADAYALLEEGQAAPLDLLFGRTTDDGEVGEDLEPDARAAHEYVDNEGSCEVCGRFRDESPHPGATVPTVPTEPAEG